jgi:molybdenum cofactor cytidylyltransferase
MNTAVIVLAAGASSRLGAPKQLAKIGDETLLARALRTATAAATGPVIVVLGANAEQIRAAVDLSAVRIVLNEHWQQGMATSLQAGIAEAAVHNVAAALVMTCDMPFVSPDHLRQLAELSAATGKNTASSSDGWRGIPACFRRESFAAIAALIGDTGGRALLIDAPTVTLLNGTDVDTPEELHTAQRLAS